MSLREERASTGKDMWFKYKPNIVLVLNNFIAFEKKKQHRVQSQHRSADLRVNIHFCATSLLKKIQKYQVSGIIKVDYS